MNSKKSSDEGMKIPKKPLDEFRSKSNISPTNVIKKTTMTKTKSQQASEKNLNGHRKLTGSILGEKNFASSASGIPVSVAK
jgi:hypothetical protein